MDEKEPISRDAANSTPLVVFDYAIPKSDDTTGYLAFWALFLACLFPFFVATGCSIFGLAVFGVLVSSPAALVLGWVAFRQQPNAASRKKSVIAIWLGTIQVALILVYLPFMGASKESANRRKCASHLRQIGQGLALYANDNAGQLPLRFDQLISETDLFPEAFICSSSNDKQASGKNKNVLLADFAQPGRCSYVYLGAGMHMKNLPAGVVLAYEPLMHHEGQGLHVLYGDGSVVWHPAKDAQRILDALATGQNPPATQPATGQ